MIGPFVQITVMVGLTHGFRALERFVGPRRSGLLMGLPSTTALTLISCGLECGLEEATLASETCLVGMVAATSLPLSYAKAVATGRTVPSAAFSAVLIYVIIALGLWWLPKAGPGVSVMIAGSGLALACHLACKIPERCPPAEERKPPARPSAWVLAGRTAVPVVYVVLIRILRRVAGSAWSGRFITFPGGSLALLITTHLESGPAPARRMAIAMPAGGLGTLAFLSTFRFGCPSLGLGWGTTAGYVAAFSTLLTVDFLGRREGLRERIRLRRWLSRWLEGLRVWSEALRIDGGASPTGRFLHRRMMGRGFSPGFEVLIG